MFLSTRDDVNIIIVTSFLRKLELLDKENYNLANLTEMTNIL